MRCTEHFSVIITFDVVSPNHEYTGSRQSGKKNKTEKEVFAESRCLRESITCENGSLIRHYESTSRVNRSNVMIVVIKLTGVEMPLFL